MSSDNIFDKKYLNEVNGGNMSAENMNTPDSFSLEADIFGMKPNSYCMLLHLSQLLVLMIPPFGLAAPIVLWIIAKDRSTQVDQHGKIIANWLLSLLIYCAVGIACSVCLLVVTFIMAVSSGLPIGIFAHILTIPIVFVLMILMVICPIIGGMRANEGVAWKYPLSIAFFK